MERLSKHLALLVMVLHSPSFWAQDPFFLQYDLLPMCINPAIAGADSGMHWTNVSQWANANDGAFALNAGSVDETWGLGLMIQSHSFLDFSSKSVLFMPSYGMSLSKGRHLRVGASLGYIHHRLVLPPPDPIGAFTYQSLSSETSSANFASAGLGLAYKGSRMSSGLSTIHINEPTESLQSGMNILPMRVNAHTTFTFPFFQTLLSSSIQKSEDPERELVSQPSDSTELEQKVKIHNGDIILHALYVRQGQFQTALVGVKRQLKNGLRFGVSLCDLQDSGSQFILTVGMAWYRIQFDYGHRISISGYSQSHETRNSLTVGVAFGKAYHGDRKMRKARGIDVEPQVSEDQPAEE